MLIVFVILSVIKNQTIEIINDNGTSFRLDYLFHYTGYSGLAILSLINNISGNKSPTFRHTRILLVFAVAVLTEGVQYFIPWRRFNPLDILMNVAGVVTGLIFTYLIIFPLITRILKRYNI